MQHSHTSFKFLCLKHNKTFSTCSKLVLKHFSAICWKRILRGFHLNFQWWKCFFSSFYLLNYLKWLYFTEHCSEHLRHYLLVSIEFFLQTVSVGPQSKFLTSSLNFKVSNHNNRNFCTLVQTFLHRYKVFFYFDYRKFSRSNPTSNPFPIFLHQSRLNANIWFELNPNLVKFSFPPSLVLRYCSDKPLS